MKKYTKPFLTVTEINSEDIIQTSGDTLIDGGAEGDFAGGGANAGWGGTTKNLNQTNMFQ